MGVLIYRFEDTSPGDSDSVILGTVEEEVLRICNILLRLQQVPWVHSGASSVFFESYQGCPAFVLPQCCDFCNPPKGSD